MLLNTAKVSNFVSSGDKTGAFESAVTKGYNPSVYGDIYITGFGYIIWVKLPSFMKDDTAGLGNFQDLCRTLYKTVQIPDLNLNTTEVVTGFAGTNKISVPTTLDLDTTISITYNEISGTPITKFHQRWISAIRDPASGLASMENYGLDSYSGTLLYITTKPVHYTSGKFSGGKSTENMIETAHLFTHVYPITDKQSNFSMSIENSDRVEIDMPYKFSQMWMGEKVNAFAQAKLKEIAFTKDMELYDIGNEGLVNPSF